MACQARSTAILALGLLVLGSIACGTGCGDEHDPDNTTAPATMGAGSGGALGSAAVGGGLAPSAGNGGASGAARPGTGAGAGGNGAVAGGGAAAGAMSPTSGGAAPALTGDDFASDVTVAVHDDVNTILVVTWKQAMAAEMTWLEFEFEAGNVMKSRAHPGTAGDQRDVVLGVPGATMVTIRVVSQQGGMEYKSKDYQGMTEAVPSGMPKPTVIAYDAAIASKDRWLFGAVENSDGGCNNQSCYYHTTFWLYIMDRKGRIVWYYADPASNATSSFQRRARDGEYIWIEKRPFGSSGERSVLKMTLDHAYSEEIPVPGLADCIDVTDDGSLLYDVTRTYVLREMTRDGKVRDIWSCREHFGTNFQCYSNTINWNKADDSIVMSFPEHGTVIQIDRKTGNVVGQYGEAPGSYAFSPMTWGFGYQHFPNITPEGTLILSSHMPGYEDTDSPVAGQHAFMEFTIDRQAKTLVEKWIYKEGQEWAMYKGMAIRMANGNTLANYGTGGVIREITPDKRTAFHVKFDSTRGNDFFNKMVGNNELIDDLYALNGGGPK
jgi:hypothetical protein